MSEYTFKPQAADWRGPSALVKDNFPWEEILLGKDPSVGYGKFDDFLDVFNMASVTAQNGYYAYLDTYTTAKTLLSTVAHTVTLEGGIMNLLLDGTDNNSISFAHGSDGTSGGGGGLYRFAATTALIKSLVFECRWQPGYTIASRQDSFVGLVGTGFCADNIPWNDSDVLSTAIDYIGFTLVGDATAPHIDFVWNKTSGTAATIASIYTLTAADITAIAAGGFIKTGFRLDDLGNLHLYVNGVECLTSGKLWLPASIIYPSGAVLAASGTAGDGSTTIQALPTLGMGFGASVKAMGAYPGYINLDWHTEAQTVGVTTAGVLS